MSDKMREAFEKFIKNKELHSIIRADCEYIECEDRYVNTFVDMEYRRFKYIWQAAHKEGMKEGLERAKKECIYTGQLGASKCVKAIQQLIDKA